LEQLYFDNRKNKFPVGGMMVMLFVPLLETAQLLFDQLRADFHSIKPLRIRTEGIRGGRR